MAGLPSFLLSTVLVIASFSVNCCFAFTCDYGRPASQCLASLPSSVLCGTRPLTAFQRSQINPQLLEDIEDIGGPVYEGSPEADRLGLTPTNSIVDLTFDQENYYRRCEDQLLVEPVDFTDDGGFQDNPQRRKRQIVDNSCCAPSPVSVRILASVASNGRAVQVVQPPGLGQFFQDARNCPNSGNCAVQCGPVQTTVPAEVILFNPPRLGRTSIVIDVCGGVAIP